MIKQTLITITILLLAVVATVQSSENMYTQKVLYERINDAYAQGYAQGIRVCKKG